MESLKLELNQRIEILRDKKVYFCNVQEELDGKPIISIPVCNSEYLILKEDEVIDAVYYDKNYGVYGFFIKIEGRRLEGKVSCYIVSKPFNVRKIQRREYVRVNIIESIRCIVDHEEIDEQYYDATLLELSGGGLRIKMSKKLNIGDKLICDLADNDSILKVQGKVIRIISETNREFVYGICFDEISDRVRDRIIKNVFLVMRKQRELC